MKERASGCCRLKGLMNWLTLCGRLDKWWNSLLMADGSVRNSRLIAHAKEFCRELRKNQTSAEKVFWETVRDRRLFGRKFYRQHPIFIPDYERDSFFVADFYCHERKLVVEIDGKVHDFQQDYDAMRTHLINKRGLGLQDSRMLRFNCI